MKQIKINRIEYTNFKGINHFVLDLDGQNATVSAANNIGKTTLYDGFYWLLFDKNSQEQAQFRIKPFDKDGKDILGTDTSVEAELMIDGERVLLKKEVLEKWTNPKNSLEKVRGKDAKKYYINGVPIKTKKEYTEFIADVIDENSFKLLTNPAYFAAKNWDERRRILLELTEAVSIDDVIAFDEDFELIREELEKHSLEDLKKKLESQIKEFKKTESDLSTRIDEANKNVPVINETKDVLKKQLSEMEAKYQELQAEQSDIMNGGTVSKLKRDIEAIQSKMHEGRIKYSQTNQLSIEGLQNDLNHLGNQYRTETDNLYDVNQKIERLDKHVASEKERRQILLDQYHTENGMGFDTGSSVCKCCGQPLPLDKVDELQQQFNTNKSKKLEQILAEGTNIKEALSLADSQRAELVALQKELSDKVLHLKANGEQLKREVEALTLANGSYEDTEEYELLSSQGLEIQARISDEQESKQGLLSDIEANINELRAVIVDTEVKIASIDQAELQKKRVEELVKERAGIVDQFNLVQGKLALADEFFKTQIKLQEDKVNEQFEMTKFIFFGETADGEEKDMCSITVKGSDYHTNLNNAARINAGLDIINTLSKSYGIAAPIFIDNAEGVNKLFETQSQMISLVVSTDPDFRVEVEL